MGLGSRLYFLIILNDIVANTDEALQIFDGVTCAKGASVLR